MTAMMPHMIAGLDSCQSVAMAQSAKLRQGGTGGGKASGRDQIMCLFSTRAFRSLTSIYKQQISSGEAGQGMPKWQWRPIEVNPVDGCTFHSHGRRDDGQDGVAACKHGQHSNTAQAQDIQRGPAQWSCCSSLSGIASGLTYLENFRAG